MQRLCIIERLSHGVRILDLDWPSDIDQEPVLVPRIQRLIQAGDRTFLLNCERLVRIDSAGIGELVRSHQIVKESQGRVVFVNLNVRIRRYLETTGLFALLETAETEAAGLLLLGIEP